MWKASAGHQINQAPQADDDDWDTDPNFVNDITEEEQRWGSKTIEGSGRTGGAIDMQKLREETENADAAKKKKEIDDANTGYGYGGKFGVEKDRMDKSAMGHDYIGKVDKHASQKDYSDGFGGKFGVQSDRVDKSAENWDYKEKVVKHSSQKDYSEGFGGKYGVQTDRVDKSALGWDHVEKVDKHESQKDYSVGFGGKFGVQEDRKDKSALGWDHVEAPQKHESQTEYKKGFGGQFGVMSDRMDKSAIGFQEQPDRVGTNYTKVKPDIGGAKPSNLRAKFENMAKFTEDDTLQRAAEQKRIREERDQKERDEALKKQSQVNTDEPKLSNQRRVPIDTGRQGSIGNAITAFNQVQSPTEAAPERKEPIKLPKKMTKVIPVQPDIIPMVEPPVVETIEDPKETQPIVAPAKRLSVSEERNNNQNQENVSDNIAQKTVLVESAESITRKTAVENKKITDTQNSEQIYQNQEDISEYIEDTGLVAIALYDYQAAAEDELSFDPDDVITHIEMIDEGWWRGLSKNRYGLFPANYVQLMQQ